MTHAEFVAALGAGKLPLSVDRRLAARHLNSRLLMPLVRLPLLGTGVALALLGWLFSALALLAVAALLPWLVARAAPQMVLDEAFADPERFAEFLDNGIFRLD
jgi:hypothetical protein